MGKEAGIPPFWGPVSYKLATTKEEVIPEIKMGFGWGSAQVVLPASTRMVGVLGLSAMGLSVSLSQLSKASNDGTGPGPSVPGIKEVPPAIEENTFTGMMAENTRITHIQEAQRDPDDPMSVRMVQVPLFTIDWDTLREQVKSQVPVINPIFTPATIMNNFRVQHDLILPFGYTDISKARYDEILKKWGIFLSKKYE